MSNIPVFSNNMTTNIVEEEYRLGIVLLCTLKFGQQKKNLMFLTKRRLPIAFQTDLWCHFALDDNLVRLCAHQNVAQAYQYTPLELVSLDVLKT